MIKLNDDVLYPFLGSELNNIPTLRREKIEIKKLDKREDIKYILLTTISIMSIHIRASIYHHLITIDFLIFLKIMSGGHMQLLSFVFHL
jgi:hypothetical protein